MIEAYVSPTGRGNAETSIANCVDASSREREERLRPAIIDTLTETRKKQYTIIEELRALQTGLNGTPFPDEAVEEWNGLVELTWQIADANDAIARIVKDCRELIGT